LEAWELVGLSELFLEEHKGVCNESLLTVAGAGFSLDTRRAKSEPNALGGTIHAV